MTITDFPFKYKCFVRFLREYNIHKSTDWFMYLALCWWHHYCSVPAGHSTNKSHQLINSHWLPKLQYTNYAGFRLACSSPLCRYAAWSSLAVSELQLSAATPLWLYHRAASLPSWIEFNCLRSAAVGKAAWLSINWLDAACRLGHPSAASGAWAVVQISSSKRQCGKRQVSLKPE